MRFHALALAGLLAAASPAAERHKLVIDPESDDGVLLQRIQQEPSPEKKEALLEQFAAQYPKAPSLAWVYDQLLPVYLEAKRWDKLMITAKGVLAVDPDDLNAAYAALQAAENQRDSFQNRKYAVATWDAADWNRRSEFLTQTQGYAESVLASEASAETSAAQKAELIHALELRNPHSKYLAAVKKNIRVHEEATDPAQAFMAAERGLATDPNNEDYLMVVANHYLNREQEMDRVLTYALRVLDVLERKARPESVSPEAWQQKKIKYLGGANWIAGVVYGKQGRYGLSDKYLRASLSNIQSDQQLLAAAYFYLGYDNYALAGQLRDRGRAIESAKFSRLCLAIEGPFQPLAQKNLEVLRNEFNIE